MNVKCEIITKGDIYGDTMKFACDSQRPEGCRKYRIFANRHTANIIISQIANLIS